MTTGKTFFLRVIALMMTALTFSIQADAVLKEENLDKTLAILKTELTTQYEEIYTHGKTEGKKPGYAQQDNGGVEKEQPKRPDALLSETGLCV